MVVAGKAIFPNKISVISSVAFNTSIRMGTFNAHNYLIEIQISDIFSVKIKPKRCKTIVQQISSWRLPNVLDKQLTLCNFQTKLIMNASTE